jgi:hypothetical protein
MMRGRAVSRRYKPVVVPHEVELANLHQSVILIKINRLIISLKQPTSPCIIVSTSVADMPGSAICIHDGCTILALTGKDLCAEHI